MLTRFPSAALHQKTIESYTDKRGKGRAFGEPTRFVRDVEALASGPAGYDPELAYLMSIISAWSYADERVLGAKLRYYGVEGAHVRRVTVQNNALLVVTTAYLVQSASGKVGVLAFRGSDPANFISVLTDTQVMHRPFSGGQVHSGFYTSVEVVWDDVHETLDAARQGVHLDYDGKRRQLKEPLQTLYITGHSLGAAMAMLAAARLHAPDYADWSPETLIRGVYTFGQPMVGNEAFAQFCTERFGERLFRHVFQRDVVPHLPPRSELRYAHTGFERRSSSLGSGWYESQETSGRARLTRAVSDVLLNWIEARATVRDWFPGLSIDDHMPANYLEVSRRALDPKNEGVVPRRSLLPRVAVEVVDAARSRMEGAMKKWLGAEQPAA